MCFRAGTLSDILVRKAKKTGAGLVGTRTKVVLAYGLGTAAAMFAFANCPNVPQLQWAAVAVTGFFMYGPQMLIGLCAAEVRTAPSMHLLACLVAGADQSLLVASNRCPHAGVVPRWLVKYQAALYTMDGLQ